MNRRDLIEAAKRYRQPGVSNEHALLLAAAEITAKPLDPYDRDDACVILRAEQLLAEHGVREALRRARQELNDWRRDSGTRMNPLQDNAEIDVLPEIPISSTGDW